MGRVFDEGPVSQSLLQDKKWALYKQSKGQSLAMEDRCEQCWRTWQAGFSWLTWDELCKEYGNSTSPYLPTIEAVMEKVCNGTLPNSGPSVFQSREVTIEITKQMLVATEADLRKRLALSRVPRSLLQSLPSLELPGESGVIETHYAFLPDDGSFKTCTMKQVMSCTMESEMMEQGKEYWDGQGEKTFLHHVQVQGKASGISSLLRDPHRATTFAEWRSAKFDATKDARETQTSENVIEIDQDEDEAEHGDDDSKPAVSQTLQGVAAEMTLQRAGSAVSLDNVSTPLSKTNKQHLGTGTGSSKGSVKDSASVKAGSGKQEFLGGNPGDKSCSVTKTPATVTVRGVWALGLLSMKVVGESWLSLL